MAELIIPPELARMVSKMSSTRDLDVRVGKVMTDTGHAIGHPRPPRYGSLVSTRVQVNRVGFAVSSSGEVAMGAEYGGRSGRYRSYATRSRRGTPYLVRRRTTMQFLPNLGTRGYAIMPAMRRSMSGIHARLLTAVEEAVTG
jgi:hypothetical protein